MSTSQGSTTEKAKDAANEAASQAREVGGHATQAGKEVTQTAKEGAQQVMQDVRTQGSQLTQEAKQQFHGIAQETSSQLRDHASTQTDKAAQQLRSLSEHARAFAEGRTDEAGSFPQYAEQATQKLETFVQRLEDGGIDGAMDDIRTFARRKPGTFLLAAGAIGFLGGRVLRGAKAANEQQSTQQIAQQQQVATSAPTIYLDEPSYTTDELTSPTTARSGY